MSSSKIQWGPPPPIRHVNRRKRGKVQRFVDALRSRPGVWARYPHMMKGSSMPSHATKRFPGTEWTSRSNGDGTYTIYGRWVGEASTDPSNPDFVELP